MLGFVTPRSYTPENPINSWSGGLRQSDFSFLKEKRLQCLRYLFETGI